MHMADALLSPAVGGTMWAVTAGTLACCAKKVRQQSDDREIPLMGVLGAFLFAAQMINFSIPATGSSGHLGGGLLLAVLLGPHAAFLVIASVLVVQALFFADGGLLALGCNIFNMGFIPAFIVYPFIYRKIAGTNPNRSRLTTAIMISAVVTFQLGPFSVVLETWCSGISALPFSTFLLLMQPLHLAIGIVEGCVTVAIVSFVQTARPEIIQGALETRPVAGHPVRALLLVFLAAALLTGGIVPWYSSNNPDGLAWAISKVTGREELKSPDQGLHGALAALQGKTAFLPDYSFGKPVEAPAKPDGWKKDEENRFGTSLSGVIGGLLTLALVFLGGLLLKWRAQNA